MTGRCRWLYMHSTARVCCLCAY